MSVPLAMVQKLQGVKRTVNIKTMSITKYRNWPFDDFGSLWPWSEYPTSFTYRGQWVDPDKYDIIPKKEYQQTLIENKQKQIEQAEESVARLKEELKELKKNS